MRWTALAGLAFGLVGGLVYFLAAHFSGHQSVADSATLALLYGVTGMICYPLVLSVLRWRRHR